MKIRRKQFAIPAAVVVGANVLGAGVGALGLKQGADAQKQQEQAMEEARIQSAKQNRALKKIAEVAEKNPAVAQKTVDTMQQKSYSIVSSATRFLARNPKLSENIKNIGGFAKDMGKFAMTKKKEIGSGLMSGAGIAGMSYAADKAVQKDAKKNNIPIGIPQEQRSYAAPAIATKGIINTAKNIGKKALNFGKDTVNKKNLKSALGWGAVMGAAPVTMGYMADKQQYKDQVAATSQAPSQRSYAATAGGIMNAAKSVMSGAKNFFRNPGQNIKSMGQKISNSWTNSKGRRGQIVVDNTIGFMGGGKAGREEMVSGLKKIGQESGNKYTQNLTNLLDKNKKTAGVTTGIIGLGTMSVGFGQGEKLTKDGLKKIDRDAYKYQESKENQV